jgi:hypothetical protein
MLINLHVNSCLLITVFRASISFSLKKIIIRCIVGNIKKERRKSKTIPITGRGGPYCCEMSRILYFVDIRLTDRGEIISITRRPSFTTQETFLLEAESNPGRRSAAEMIG